MNNEIFHMNADGSDQKSCARGLIKLFEKMMEKGFDLQINQYNRNLLHLAAAGGSMTHL
jgi:hypothetical protein